jgi:hypothetical protein
LEGGHSRTRRWAASLDGADDDEQLLDPRLILQPCWSTDMLLGSKQIPRPTIKVLATPQMACPRWCTHPRRRTKPGDGFLRWSAYPETRAHYMCISESLGYPSGNKTMAWPLATSAARQRGSRRRVPGWAQRPQHAMDKVRGAGFDSFYTQRQSPIRKPSFAPTLPKHARRDHSGDRDLRLSLLQSPIG